MSVPILIVWLVACLAGGLAYHLTIRANGGALLGIFLALLSYTVLMEFGPGLFGN